MQFTGRKSLSGNVENLVALVLLCVRHVDPLELFSVNGTGYCAKHDGSNLTEADSMRCDDGLFVDKASLICSLVPSSHNSGVVLVMAASCLARFQFGRLSQLANCETN